MIIVITIKIKIKKILNELKYNIIENLKDYIKKIEK